MATSVLLPTNFDISSMYPFISKVMNEQEDPIDNTIYFDFSTLTQFIEPVGVTVLSNLIEWLRSKDAGVYFAGLPRTPLGPKHPISYLDDSGFFKLYLGKPLFPQSSLRPTTIPLRNVAYEESYGWLDNTFLPWLQGTIPYLNNNGLQTIKVCLQEIFNNIRDHSEKNIGCVFAQHYPCYYNRSKESIVLAISDFGVGIPYQVRKKVPEVDDANALRLAIQEGFTTKTLPTNAGAGLDVLVSNVIPESVSCQ